MNDFVRNLLTEWRKLNLPSEDKTFVIAVSGGADSVSLALALHDLKKREKLKLRFVIAHFNHNLRGAESDEDENFVKDLAVRYNFELALGHGEIAEKGNLEQSARVARYDFLTNVAENLRAYAVLTAHTVNDQAETFLLNLIRGSGIEGLSGMKPIRSLKEVQSPKSEDSASDAQRATLDSRLFLARPLLNWAKRSDTENFCHAENLEYRYDSMNEDLAFKRVRIRRVLLPLLQDFNPKIIERLATTARLLRDEHEELKKYTNHHAAKAERKELKTGDLKKLSPAVRRRVLRLWLEARRGDLRRLDLKHLEAVEQLIFSRKSGRMVELPGGEIVVKTKGMLVFK